MEIKEMTIEALEERKAQIGKEIEVDGADLNALEEEVKSINAEIETRKNIEAKKVEIRKSVAEKETVTTVVKDLRKENKDMEIETRNTKEYIHAFVNYIKSGSDKECRALLTENAASGGQVPVPELVENIVTHAWDNLGIVNLIKKSYLKGNVKLGFEISSTGAEIHTEGGEDIDEETLTLGIVSLVPASIKKWITISDETLDLSDSAFLSYVYEEITYQIGKKLEDDIINTIATRSTSDTSSAVGVPQLAKALGIDVVIEAFGLLGDEARDLTVVCNKATYTAIKAAAKQAKYAQDPFEGYRVVFNNSLPSYADSEAGDVYLILGDFGHGYQANFPNGQDITLKWDDLSLAEKDLVKIVGRKYVGHDIIAPKSFVNVVNP